MPLQFNAANHTYAWHPQSPRPAKPANFSQELLNRFLASHYAQNTSLAAFLLAHPNAINGGVLNQLHRRHIISWDLIKSFAARCAAVNFNHEIAAMLNNVFLFFRIHPQEAANLPHGNQRANAWQQVAHQMCWVDTNVFVGPSAGNVGVDIDQAEELTDAERRDLLAGAVWQGAGTVHAQMVGFTTA